MTIDPSRTAASWAPHRTIQGQQWDFDRRVLVLAIINRTRDSFFDGGRTFDLSAAIEACHRAIADGADGLDIGGVPFSPDAEPVSPQEEIDRVLPLVTALADSGALLSVDTTRAAVAREVLAAGAGIINDTSGMHDPAMAAVVTEHRAQLVLTHSLAAPWQHLARPHYDDVVTEVADQLAALVERALAAGLRPDQLVIDPGPDLNKNTLHTLELVRHFGRFVELGPPVLVAVSNKDFIGETLDRAKPDRLAGTLAATTACLLAGGRLVRAHQVAPTVDAVRTCEALLGMREPALLRHNR